ncbi:SDR family oxidoreductase [Galbibacter sp. EGI 63066]|uniref:NAD(P)-dependent oxidoreductase n=1 Tax=Galbibacter sp. EGI 63066 TaxID=2993559 RepID=UPI00224922E8|nr:NAD(P)-binding oxidoreductase [Galbibacter sp. EGI 63066]MCX2681173.1 SDR family oxidoreductase [Galbibacter sp. EGI 63066]
MEILVIGATGRTGRYVVKQALNEGHRVTAFVRSPEKLDYPQTGVTTVQGNVLDVKEVQNLVNNQRFDAVVVAIGDSTLKRSTVRAVGTKNIITALENRNVSSRLWVISSAGINESMDQLGFISKTFLKTILKGHLRDHSNQEKYVRESRLPYTIVRPVGLSDEAGDNDYMVLEKGKVKTNRIPRMDVAHFIVKNIGNDDFIEKAVVLCDNKEEK